MSWLAKALFTELVALTAPVVCLVYRRGWFATPDDPKSPFGMSEPFIAKLNARFGTFASDYWWCGWRNRAYGLSYALKPDWLKALGSYINLPVSVEYRGPLRTIRLFDLREYTLSLGFCHIIAGYRLRPIFDGSFEAVPVRPVNMDGRPIITIRFGGNDD